MKQMTENALPIHIHDERNGLDYTLYGDYYLPNLEVPKEQRPIGRWGRMRLVYLKEHRPGLYTRLILSGTLDSHLADVNEQAETRFDTILSGYKRLYGISEQLKAGSDALGSDDESGESGSGSKCSRRNNLRMMHSREGFVTSQAFSSHRK